MQADSPMRPSPRLSLLLALLVIAGCGTGEGPTPIPGNPAPPLPDGFCDAINFESACGPFDFINFGGGSSSTTVNPKRGGLNTTEKVAKMQKFADQTFGGSRLDVRSGSIDFTQGGEAFTMKVWASREVAVTFKLEGLGRERVVNHSGGETWEALCFDFTGDTAGDPVAGITFIFDNGEKGDAENDPDAWTFYFDEIEQVESCPAPPPLFPVDFEGDPASYDFGRDEPGFGGGITTVIANPDRSGLNTSAQTARMQKFAGEVFGGSSLILGRDVDFSRGEAFTMKVWASRSVPVLFKFEGPDPTVQTDDREETLSHSGSGQWEELCFDFTSATAGFASRAITFIFDLGQLGDAEGNPDDWTFYFDEIEQVESCGDGGPAPLFPVDFEGDPASYDFGPDAGFGGGVSTVIANPDQSGINASAQTARMQKFAGEVFGGSTLNLGRNVDFSRGEAFRMKVWASRSVPVLFKLEGLNQERSVSHSGSGGWEQLCFDFTGSTAGPVSSAITFIFDLGVAGDAANDPDNWTLYYDDIEQAADCGIPAAAFPVDFEGDPASYDFGPDAGFGGGVSTVIANPDQSGINASAQTARMQKFGGEVFGGSTLSLGGNIDFTQGPAFKLKVWASRAVPVLFKLEGLNQERSVTHSGSGGWEQLCFDFTGSTDGPASSAITFIFDLGVNGDAANNPDDWTFYYDDIEQAADCATGGGGGTPTTVDFEGDPASFDFGPDGGFGGGVSTVLANPDQSGINTSAQVVRMQKFAGEVFGGSTLALPAGVDWSQGETFTMKVWSQRGVPVLFKLEGLNQERSDGHDGGSQWQELCFDFAGATAGGAVTGITVIFDLGVAGDAANDPDNWTFYYDDIQQKSGGCGGGGGGPALGPVDFEPEGLGQTFAWTVFENGDNPAVALLPNPDATGVNTSATVAQFTARPAGQPFAGAVTSDLPTFTLNSSNSCVKIKVWKPVISDVGIKFETGSLASTGEITVANTVTNQWEELTFDFSVKIGEPTSTDITGFVLFPDFAARAQDNVIYFDDIQFLDGAECGGGGGTPAIGPVDFEAGGLGQAFAWTVFENVDNPAIAFLANPDPTGVNTSTTVAQFTARQAGQPFAGAVTSDLPTFTLNSSNSCVKIKVWKPVISDVGIKFETGSLASTGEITVANTVTNQWEELTFDFSVKIGEPTSTDITGFVLFPDFAARTQDNVMYFDDIVFLDGGQCP